MGKIRGIKKIRRKCMVRNCRNFDSYSVSCTGELGQSIHICEECARDIVRAIDEKYPKVITPLKDETLGAVEDEAAENATVEQVKTDSKSRKGTKKKGE